MCNRRDKHWNLHVAAWSAFYLILIACHVSPRPPLHSVLFYLHYSFSCRSHIGLPWIYFSSLTRLCCRYQRGHQGSFFTSLLLGCNFTNTWPVVLLKRGPWFKEKHILLDLWIVSWKSAFYCSSQAWNSMCRGGCSFSKQWCVWRRCGL